MPYCTLDDITATVTTDDVLQLTDDEGAGVINTVRVDEAIAKSDGLILAFTGVVPDPVPEIIRQISVELSIYHLYKRRFASNMPESIDKGYSRAIDLLKQIQSGKISIGAAEADQSVVSGQYATNRTRDDRLFGKYRLAGY
jgi:phage gp36-like protein